MMLNSPLIGRTSKPSLLLLVVAACLGLTTLTGCNTSAALKKAATDKGVASARVRLPPLPGDCREDVPHAVAAVGDEVRSILKAERRQLDKSNARGQRCAGFYDQTAKALK